MISHSFWHHINCTELILCKVTEGTAAYIFGEADRAAVIQTSY